MPPEGTWRYKCPEGRAGWCWWCAQQSLSLFVALSCLLLSCFWTMWGSCRSGCCQWSSGRRKAGVSVAVQASWAFSGSTVFVVPFWLVSQCFLSMCGPLRSVFPRTWSWILSPLCHCWCTWWVVLLKSLMTSLVFLVVFWTPVSHSLCVLSVGGLIVVCEFNNCVGVMGQYTVMNVQTWYTASGSSGAKWRAGGMVWSGSDWLVRKSWITDTCSAGGQGQTSQESQKGEKVLSPGITLL